MDSTYVKLRKARKFRLEPTPEQENFLSRAVGCVRFVWNRALSIQKSYLDQQCGRLNYVEMAKCLTSWRQSETMGFLAESPSQTQQMSLKHLDRAFNDAFDKSSAKQFPKFKKKGLHDSMRYPSPDQLKFDLHTVDQDRRRVLPKIFLPMIGWVKFRKSCYLGGEIRNATVSRSGGHWYVAIQVEQTVQKPVHPSSTAVGGDVGVANLLTLSDGTVFAPITAYRDVQSKLAREQRKLSHKKKFSANWKKQQVKISRLHQRIAHIRSDVLHKISTTISKNHAVAVLEDLRVRSMTASAKGTVAKPGRNIRQKSGLNKAILDQGWSLLRQMLEYKLTALGGMLLLVNPAYTSQGCSECGYVSRENRPSQAVFQCQQCGHTEHADLNAAKNIIEIGLAGPEKPAVTVGHTGLVCSAI